MEDKKKIGLDEAVDAYQTWRKARGVATSTFKRDAATLNGFIKAAGNVRVSSLTTDHVDDFFVSRASLSPQTQNLDLSTLRSFFMFLESRGYHPRAMSLLIDYKKLTYAPKSRRRVPIGEFPVLLDSAARPRDRALIALGLYLFLRSSEIRLLRIKHVSLAEAEVSVKIPKTKEADVMPMAAELEKELRWWLSYYQEQCGPLDPEWFLIPNITPSAWDRDEAGRMTAVTGESLIPSQPIGLPQKAVQRALAAIGWTDVYWEGVHTLRRSGARALYDELAASDGHSNALETVSAMLHHKVMATTQLYLGLTESRRKRDKLIRGKAMFPSLGSSTVKPMISRKDGTHG